ncbi:MAG: DNA-binding protein [Candidatus Moranbacteria bacterium]|jgi:hypothetical protein|nr:DNA-binding protein [Candidatus Moranbacteria bacterium]
MNEIEIYQGHDKSIQIEVQFEQETVWLTQKQMALLFEKNIMTVNEHIRNIYEEQELDQDSTIRKSLIVQKEGKREVKREVLLYNLDVIISVGYRVKSTRGTQFRIWATQRLKDYLLKGYAINNRMNRLEDKFDNLEVKVNQIDLQINTHLIPTQGVFFDGQVFDAYKLASKIIRSATQTIVLIDNYIDESTFTHLSKKMKGVNVVILTKAPGKQLMLDLKKANEQYGNFTLKSFFRSHDRFLIIDDQEVFHLGASLKDLGKKWFAFSKLDKTTVQQILTEVKQL